MRKATRISLALGTSAALLSLSALPASAVEGEPTPAPAPANATAEITVEGGYLAIGVSESPASETLKPGETATFDSVNVTVTDERAGIGGWTVSATLTDFTARGEKDIPAHLVSYASSKPESFGASLPTLTVGGGVFAPNSPPVEGQITKSSVAAVSAADVSGNNAVRWGATLSLPVPADALAGTYRATLTHSFI